MLKNLNTPCLILDQSKLYNNIRKIKTVISSRKLEFRPHLKTAKCREIAKILVKEFGALAMVSTIEEIEQLKGCGISDFLYSVAIIPNKFDRISSNLCNKCDITVAVDSLFIATALSNYCKETGNKISAVIELDLDGHRSGVKPLDHKKLIEIGRILDEKGILRGVMSHAGESYSLSDPGSLKTCSENEAEKTLYAANILRKAGLSCELVTIGSTPTALSGEFYSGITELRAGVFMFFDLVQAGIGICEINDIVLTVLTSVISVNKDIDALIIDAGWMALSRDRGTSSQSIDYGYGQVCNENGNIIKDLIVTNVQQEHGIIQIRKGSSEKLPDLIQGDLLRILPNHACSTAAAHNKYHIIKKDSNKVETWERFGGW